MKKTLSLVLMIVLFVASFSFASENKTAGEKLATLGLVKGDAQGNLLEDEKLSRAQMMVMLARLNGVEEKAEGFEQEMPFTDIPSNSYYKPFIAYAYEQGWTKGTSEEAFSPDAKVTTQMVATYMLRVLGYEVNWESAISEAAALGIADDTPSEVFTRKNAFDMIYDTVNTKVSGEDILLGEKLGVGEAVQLLGVETLSNTKIVLTFSSLVDKETVDASTFSIKEVYGEKDTLTVNDVVVKDERVILTLAPMENVLYALEVSSDLEDFYGNVIDLKTEVITFVGTSIADVIDGVTIQRIDETTIAVAFNENIDERIAELFLYSINEDVGNPDDVRVATSKDAAVEDYKKTVILSIPKTKAGQVYTLTVAEGLENIDGVKTKDVLTADFSGAGIKNNLPRIELIEALDRQTLKITFDRLVSDETIEGKIWDDQLNTLLGPDMLSVDATGNNQIDELKDFDLYDKGEAYVYQDSTAEKSLIIRLDRPVFESSDVIAIDHLFHLVVNTTYIDEKGSGKALDFIYNNEKITNPFLEGVVMLDERTLEVYFSSPVSFDLSDEDPLKVMKVLKEPGGLSDNTVVSGIESMASKNGTIWQMGLKETIRPEDVTDDMAYFYIPDGIGTDITGTVTIKNNATDEDHQSLAFAMNYKKTEGIEDVFAMMNDNRSIEVFYPEAMKVSDVINESYYSLLSKNSNDAFMTLEALNVQKGYTTYDPEKNKATLYLDQPINEAANLGILYLGIDARVENALGTKSIAEAMSKDDLGLTSGKGLVLPFAPNTNEPKRPILKSAKVTDDRYSLKIGFDEDIAFTKATNAFSRNADLTNGLTMRELLNALSINVQFENEENAREVLSKDISDISGLSNANEKDIEITFNQKLAVDSIGTVTTEGNSANQIFNRKSAFAFVNSKASKVTFGVAESLYSDGQVPVLLKEASYGTDSNQDGRLDRVTLVYDEGMKLTEKLDTNAKAKTLITELSVDDGTTAQDLREAITGVTLQGNEVMITLDGSPVGTGEIKVSLVADTGGLNGQLQDTSILVAPNESSVLLGDQVSPVLIKVTGEVGSEALGLLFSEKVSGGTPETLENLKADDLNWQDVSGDGAAFIKFVLTSKNKSSQGVVVNTRIVNNDLGKDTVSVVEDSVFDASGNPAVTTPVILGN